MRTLKRIVWDFNGTILDDGGPHFRAVNTLIRLTGGQEVTQEQLAERFVIPVATFYGGQGCDIQLLNTSTAIYYKCYEYHALDCQTHQYVPEILELLTAQKVEQIIVSNNTHESIHWHLERLHLGHHFSAVQANEYGNDVVHKQTKGDRVKELVHGYGVEEVLIIGDTVEEIEIARKLGIRSISIVSGYQAKHRLEQAGPPFMLLDSFEHLLLALREGMS